MEIPDNGLKEGSHGWAANLGSIEKFQAGECETALIYIWGKKNHSGCSIENGMECYKDLKGTVNWGAHVETSSDYQYD